MVPDRPLVIATLTSCRAADARAEVLAVREAGADAAEVRFDRWDAAERDRMHELFPSPIPLIATLRSRAEGGDGPDDPPARSLWVSQVEQRPFAWIDLEAARDPSPVTRSASAARVISSSHLAPGASPVEVRRLLNVSRMSGGIAKVVLPASMASACHDLLPIARSTRQPYVVHSTGPSGPLLRAWSRRLGMAAVYGAPPAHARRGQPAVEASQIPVDRLRRFLDPTIQPPLFAVVGKPVAHSRSPDLHHHWMEASKNIGLYLALEIESDAELAEVLPSLQEGGFRGLNVTHPFKDAAFRAAGVRTEAANSCGCANTLTFRPEGLHADNTDLVAVRRRMDELVKGGGWDGKELLVVGSGGAARAALAAGRDVGARSILLARNGARARDLAGEFGASPAPDRPDHVATLVIHATTAGRDGGTLAVPLLAWLGPGSYLLDFVYAPVDRGVERLARSAGVDYEDGARLLTYSAAASFERWWGLTLPPALIESGLGEISP
ncbi:MAG: type I 3-dehydroquinate dehydratase [Thermoplasmata archaeon]|nr:type I 3-dehydroquinate dehydratase [Thermoplasmata archaeon]